ncbi:MAG TPA: hypothetical protein VM778_11495 [Gemmatimonadota bacterium]|nr:hypothetical protein [Gemmatimonadota bacterium]
MNLSKFLSWIPGWVGFLLLILVGVAMTINGLVNKNLTPDNELGFILFGITAVVIGAFSWIAGATSEIKGRVGKVGALVEVKDMPWWAWLVDIALVIVSVVIFVVASE